MGCRLAQRRLVLVGGGHSHALVLASFAARPDARLQVTVVSPGRFSTYSGMVPGVIAGQYALRDAQIDVEALAQRASASFLCARAVRVEAGTRTLELNDRSRLAYDLLSLDIGAPPARTVPIDDGAAVIAVKPIECAAAELDTALAAPPPPAGRRVVVVGAGAGGTEVAFALAARLRGEARASIVLCDAAPHPVAERGGRTVAVVERALGAAAIRFIGGAPIARVTRTGVLLRGDYELPAEVIVWATGAGAPRLFAESGLPTDRQGCLLVGDDLRCPAHPEILAAGDCATLAAHPELPKAGVHAVRQGPVLAHNLRAAANGAAPRAYQPQSRFLALLNTGDGRAIVSYGRFAWHSRWAWRLKDWIDRRFVGQFAR